MAIDMKKVDPLGTERSERVPIDYDKQQATASFQWFLENNQSSHPITTGNEMMIFICGQEAFTYIAIDIQNAQESIELICWGFDPEMALIRLPDPDPYTSANNETYGELLERKARGLAKNGTEFDFHGKEIKPVKVRLLVWYNGSGSTKQNSLVGYVDPTASLITGGGVIKKTWREKHSKPINMYGDLPRIDPADARQDRCTAWWRRATSGAIPNLEVRFRDGEAVGVKKSLADEKDRPFGDAGTHLGVVNEKQLIEEYATHHQKPILIDYNFKMGEKAVGYVMGLNSITDFWDTSAHLYDDPLRERAWDEKGDAVSVAQVKKNQSAPMSRKPQRDYAARLQGRVLETLNRNFCEAWDRAKLLPMLTFEGQPAIPCQPSEPISKANGRSTYPAFLSKPLGQGYPLKLQILRTYNQGASGYSEDSYTANIMGGQVKQGGRRFEVDKTIKQAYFQATRNAFRYLYIENQYFFYEHFSLHIKHLRESFIAMSQEARVKKSDSDILHMIVVVPEPEDKGIVPRTYDALRSLGQGSSMPKQHEYVTRNLIETPALDSFLKPQMDRSGKPVMDIEVDPLVDTANAIKMPTVDKNGVLMQDGRSLGLKVLVCKLVSCGGAGKYRDIYIHSKLMLVDDGYLTLGSANLSLRSMAADSEINVATDHPEQVKNLRKRVWGDLSAGLDGGDGSTPAIVEAFDKWKKRAAKNLGKASTRGILVGQIVQFHSKQVSSFRYG